MIETHASVESSAVLQPAQALENCIAKLRRIAPTPAAWAGLVLAVVTPVMIEAFDPLPPAMLVALQTLLFERIAAAFSDLGCAVDAHTRGVAIEALSSKLAVLAGLLDRAGYTEAAERMLMRGRSFERDDLLFAKRGAWQMQALAQELAGARIRLGSTSSPAA